MWKYNANIYGDLVDYSRINQYYSHPFIDVFFFASFTICIRDMLGFYIELMWFHFSWIRQNIHYLLFVRLELIDDISKWAYLLIFILQNRRENFIAVYFCCCFVVVFVLFRIWKQSKTKQTEHIKINKQQQMWMETTRKHL